MENIVNSIQGGIETTRSYRSEATEIRSFLTQLGKGERTGHNLYLLLLGLDRMETPRLLENVGRGLPFKTYTSLGRSLRIGSTDLARYVRIPSSTLSRRRAARRLSPDESDRVLRLARVFAFTLELFEGDAAAARRWLARPQRALGNAIPFEMLDTETGAREVEDLIGRLEHGVFT